MLVARSGHIRAHSSAQIEQFDTTQRDGWAKNVRTLTGRKKHKEWKPELTPPPMLSDVSIVLVNPKRPVSIGAVARACSCFECVDLRIISPRCDHLARASRNGSKGAQWLLYQTQMYDSLEEAIADADLSVAFTRWVQGEPSSYSSVNSLLAAHPFPDSLDTSIEKQRKSLSLVFGREEKGLSRAELEACSVKCAIPIGRLQESLSLSHAVSLALAPLFEQRLHAAGLEGLDLIDEMMVQGSDDSDTNSW